MDLYSPRTVQETIHDQYGKAVTTPRYISYLYNLKSSCCDVKLLSLFYSCYFCFMLIFLTLTYISKFYLHVLVSLYVFSDAFNNLCLTINLTFLFHLALLKAECLTGAQNIPL